MNVKVSRGNSKMGEIPSVSLPAGITCRGDCECNQKCYAKRLERLRKNVHQAYEYNYKLLNDSPDIFWREVEASIMMSRFFRFHVSGDIPNDDYLHKMIEIAETIGQGFPQVRVDLYNVKGKIYFGEMTFFAGSGMINCFTKKFQLMVGDKIILPRI